MVLGAWCLVCRFEVVVFGFWRGFGDSEVVMVR